MTTERTRTFTGKTEDGQPVMVTIFEETPTRRGPQRGDPPLRIVGMEVAFKEGEGRWSRWTRPIQMTEEV